MANPLRSSILEDLKADFKQVFSDAIADKTDLEWAYDVLSQIEMKVIPCVSLFSFFIHEFIVTI